jgi:hypothetical protein
VLVGLLLIAGLLAIDLARGSYQAMPRDALITPQRTAAGPAWTRPCWAGVFDSDQRSCVRVVGRVVWVQKHDPDGDGDRHLIVVARLHAHIVKFTRAFPGRFVPGLGARIDVTGWVEVGASGRDEIRAVSYDASGSPAAMRR